MGSGIDKALHKCKGAFRILSRFALAEPGLQSLATTELCRLESSVLYYSLLGTELKEATMFISVSAKGLKGEV